MKILVIDDSPRWCMQLAVHAGPGSQVVLKCSNADAIAWLERGNRPHCIVTEFKPAQADRYDVITYARLHPALLDVPILVWTEHEYPESVIQGVLGLCDGFQYKTARPDLFIRRIERLVQPLPA